MSEIVWKKRRDLTSMLMLFATKYVEKKLNKVNIFIVRHCQLCPSRK